MPIFFAFVRVSAIYSVINCNLSYNNAIAPTRCRKRFFLESAVPLYLDNGSTQYVKHLEKYTFQKANDKSIVLDEKYDGITKAENENLYQMLLKKAKQPVFKNRPGSALKILEEGFDKFCSLSTEEQVSALISFLSYLGMNSGTTNFKLIGGGPANGTLTLGVNITPSKKKVIIIDKSITGIYDSWFELK